MMSPEEMEMLDIWNEEFEGIQLDWSEMESWLEDEGSDNKEENCKDSKSDQEKKVKSKRGRPRMRPLGSSELSIRRNVRHSTTF